MIVVANLCQLGRTNGHFDPKKREEVLHPNVKITREYADEQNANAVSSGRYYEIDEEKTKELFPSKEAKEQTKNK